MYLSSFRVGERPDRLLALLRGRHHAEVAVIANAMDAQPGQERLAGVEHEISTLTALGLQPIELDLREFFGQPKATVAAALARFPMVWLRGGNVFMLRYALARSGADTALTVLLRQDSVVYAGYSAGSCVLAPSLHGLDYCDDPQVVRRTYGDQPVWTGLSILDYVVVPHIDSPGHPETQALTAVAANYRANGIAHRTLRDGQALVIDGTNIHLY
jgi:dipeptidase E